MVYTVERFRQDALFITEKIMDVHPRPDFRIGKDALARAKASFLNNVESCSTIHDFFKIAQRFVASIGDAHTSMMPLEQERIRAPFSLECVAGQVVIKDVMPGLPAPIERGDIVLYLDGREVGEVLREALQYVPYNYYDHGLRMALPELLSYPAGNRQTLDLVVAKANCSLLEAQIPLLPAGDAQLHGWQEAKERLLVKTAISWEIRPDIKAGYLRYQACFDRTSPYFVRQAERVGLSAAELPDMDEICNELFAELQRTGYQRLIIDLRGNGGGDSSIAWKMYKYLRREPLNSYGMTVKVSQGLKQYIERNMASYSEHHRKLVVQLLDVPPGSFRVYDDNVIKYPYGNSAGTDLPPFTGKLVVLTDSYTFSSGEWLAAELRDNNMGVFVGEPTGCGGTVPGDTLAFRTPNCGLYLVSSHKLFTRPDRSAERLPAVVPDYYVPQTLADFRAGRDTVMDWLADKLDGLLK